MTRISEHSIIRAAPTLDDVLRQSRHSWNMSLEAMQIWWTRQWGNLVIENVRQSRLSSLVKFAREKSPFYRELYRDIPQGRFSIDQLPVVKKSQLMHHFDDCVTDSAVKLIEVNSFIADRSLIGEHYLNKYGVWLSSGSTGDPGIFIQDANAISVYDALLAVQFYNPLLALDYANGILTNENRSALIVATDNHFASITAWHWLFRKKSNSSAQTFSILTPLPLLIDQLNQFQPALLASYPTVLLQLAKEKKAGRLTINPTTLWSGGECLTAAAKNEIEDTFQHAVVNEYGASECLSIGYGCNKGWIHVNADWVIVEPVDSHYKLVKPGEISFTTLITNLANRIQPIIRYDLGDSIIERPEPCECGNPLPAIRVQGRQDDVLNFPVQNGKVIRLFPMALSTVIEESSNVHRFQIIQNDYKTISLRLDIDDVIKRKSAEKQIRIALHNYLSLQELPHIRVVIDNSPPLIDRISGKLKTVVSLIH